MYVIKCNKPSGSGFFGGHELGRESEAEALPGYERRLHWAGGMAIIWQIVMVAAATGGGL